MRIALIPALVVLVLAQSPAVPAAMATNANDRLSSAFRLLDVAYPALRTEATLLRIQTGMRPGGPWIEDTFLIQAAESGGTMEERITGTTLTRALFLASFEYDDYGLARLSVDGRYVSSGENRQFAKALMSRPGWSDKDVERELRRRGAQFGPDAADAIGESILTDHMATELFGVEPLQRTNVVFVIPNAQERLNGVGEVGWLVTYRPISGRDILCSAFYEPFHGRLVSLLRYGLR
jgi:hypothetical protein